MKYIGKEIPESQHLSNLSMCIPELDHRQNKAVLRSAQFIGLHIDEIPIPIYNQRCLQHFYSFVLYFSPFYIPRTVEIEVEEKGT
jgi:hypothetical protein